MEGFPPIGQGIISSLRQEVQGLFQLHDDAFVQFDHSELMCRDKTTISLYHGPWHMAEEA